MNKKIIFITGVAAVVALSLGYVAGRGYKTYEINMKEKMAGMDHSKMDMPMEHKHEVIKTASNRVDPKIKLNAFKDTMSGYNLQISTDAFFWTPKDAGQKPVQNGGHAHIFINDVKLGRAYGEWYHIPADKFKNGTNTITVSLNANDHATWLTKAGKEVKVSIEVVK